ncbi:hypothetical protein GCK72_002362 [Caenorhabditis remanei]|uniref:Uncharacterized protein n=1 Tax=Caenorhabditis remanei TaxID=31234 RepID=A0A6A5HW47_CAERE|nr:hypothetical protein GCK72_002362 [Caenorhabditis remanei]KAF1770543.1 hypothetical protein GCK72_002362 [Caenorhabditis remanei]
MISLAASKFDKKYGKEKENEGTGKRNFMRLLMNSASQKKYLDPYLEQLQKQLETLKEEVLKKTTWRMKPMKHQRTEGSEPVSEQKRTVPAVHHHPHILDPFLKNSMRSKRGWE